MKPIFFWISAFCAVHASAQNVGIAVTAPLERLHVDSVIKIGKSAALSSGTPGRKNLLKFGDGSYVSVGEEVSDDKLYIRYGDVVFLKSLNSTGLGNIGINTETPTARLHISGSFRLEGNGESAGKVLTSDASGNATWQTSTGLTLPYAGNFSGNTDAFTITNNSSSSSGNSMYLNSTSASNNGPVLYAVSSSTTGFGIGISALIPATNIGSSFENIAVSGAIDGTLTEGIGVKGYGQNAIGVMGQTETRFGLYGLATTGIGVFGIGNGANGLAGRFVGRNGAIPLEAFNQAGGDIAVFRAISAVANKARIDGAGKGFFNGGTQTGGADVAEAFAVEGPRNTYEPGDVLVISTNTNRTVTKSTQPYSTLVVGVYATRPGVLLTERMENESQDDLVPMGVVGVIPTKVSSEGGVIHRGDLLVTSSTPGHAMKGAKGKIDFGTVIGKALEDFETGKTGVIKVLVNVK